MNNTSVAAITTVALVFIAGLVIILDSVSTPSQTDIYYYRDTPKRDMEEQKKSFSTAFPSV